jgi:two-component system, sensor histidine kinase
MHLIKNWWGNLPISKKLYTVFGVMASLIACELLTLQFAMHTLSGARALVGGESLWSKAQKDAVFSLQRYGSTKDENEYEAFKKYLKIPEGDHRARLELAKSNPDLEVIRQGFLDGNLHNDDIPAVISLLRRFYWVEYLSHAIQVWTNADGLLDQLRDSAAAYHEAIISDEKQKAAENLDRIKMLNEELTPVEQDFSYTLGVGSRWLEHVVLTILTVAVLTVESIGLTLTFLTGRTLTRSLNELNDVARKIGEGDFTRTIKVHSGDDLGRLSTSVNVMGEMLRKSYGELETRVRQRTEELAKALTIRDEFISIASHELKTPITSLKMQLQMLTLKIDREKEALPLEKISKGLEISVRQVNRLTSLIEDLLDVSRIESGKMTYNFEELELKQVVLEVVERFNDALRSANNSYEVDSSKDSVIVKADRFRIEQVTINLLSNAMKYGNGKPIQISVTKEKDRGVISIRDFGIGIDPETQSKIFARFERGNPGKNIDGLGLGLYISREIITAHDGLIKVESNPGEGARFTVEIPLL